MCVYSGLINTDPHTQKKVFMRKQMKSRAGLANKIRGCCEFSMATAETCKRPRPRSGYGAMLPGKTQTITSCKLIAPWQEMCTKFPLSEPGEGCSQCGFLLLPACHQVVPQHAKAAFRTPIDLPGEEGLVLGPRKDEVNGRVQKLKPPHLQGPHSLQRAPVLGTS